MRSSLGKLATSEGRDVYTPIPHLRKLRKRYKERKKVLNLGHSSRRRLQPVLVDGVRIIVLQLPILRKVRELLQGKKVSKLKTSPAEISVAGLPQ